MLPLRRIMIPGQRSIGRKLIQLTYCKLRHHVQSQRNLSAENQKPRKSSLYAKSEAKIYQQNIPVELDLDFNERLKDKNRLRTELTSRNYADTDIDQLERDYLILTELNDRKKKLEDQRNEVTVMMEKLVEQQKESTEPREPIDKELAEFRQKGRETKKLIKKILPQLRDVEERVMMTALKLPNRVHKDTPLTEDRVEESSGEEVSQTDELSHTDIGQMFDLIEFSNIGSKAYYLKDDLVLLEQALLTYFSDRLREGGFIQMACPEFFKDLVLDGCGIDLDNNDKIFKLRSKPDDTSATYLAGMSIMSFAAYIAKSKLKPSLFPLKYFASGRSYTPEKAESLPGLFDSTQSVKMNIFSVYGTREDGDAFSHTFTQQLCDIYKQFNVPWRVVTISSQSLHDSEEKRTEIQMWAKSIHKYVKVASVSMVSDYISRRLMIRQGSKAHPVFMVHCEALDITRLIAILLEYGSVDKDTYNLPDLDFLLDRHWIQTRN